MADRITPDEPHWRRSIAGLDWAAVEARLASIARRRPDLLSLRATLQWSERIRDVRAQAERVAVTSVLDDNNWEQVRSDAVAAIETMVADLDALDRASREPGDASAVVAPVSDRAAPSSPLDENALMSASDLARLFGLREDAARKRLDRWRRANAGSDGYIENPDRASRAPKYVY